MKAMVVMTLVPVALLCAACKKTEPEPIPGPKADNSAQFHPAGIAWFQGGIDEAFARTAEVRRPAPRNPPTSCPGRVQG